MALKPLINIASIAGTILGYLNLTHYSASKAATAVYSIFNTGNGIIQYSHAWFVKTLNSLRGVSQLTGVVLDGYPQRRC